MKYSEFTSLDGERLDFGILKTPSHMVVLSQKQTKEDKLVQFGLNLRRKHIYVRFAAWTGTSVREYRLEVPLEQLAEIFQVRNEPGYLSFVLSLRHPPRFFRRYGDVKTTHDYEADSWRDDDRWFRQTDIEADTNDQLSRGNLPVDLKQNRAGIKLGRWTTYRLRFSDKRVKKEDAENIANILRDHNITIGTKNDFSFSTESNVLWQFLEDGTHHSQHSYEILMSTGGTPTYSIPFPVRYALEVCISNNYLNEYSMGEDFARRLSELSLESESRAVGLLEYISNKKIKVFNPLEIFDIWRPKLAFRKPKLPKNCVSMRSVIVTPTTIIVREPTVEVTNRVLRQYQHLADRFLRVRFEDDEFRGNKRIYATDKGTMNEVFTRVLRTLSSGVVIGDRTYDFLAYGNSQLREHGAYFFASTPTVTAASIRAWMGTFSHERIIAKHAARIGQCFSTTRAVRGARVSPVRKTDLLPDVERNGFNFTDGVGKIAPFLAHMVTVELGIKTQAGGTPSVFQFRLSGCKGILAVAPAGDNSVKSHGLAIRKSQYKFEAEHHGLEIIRHSEFWSASLNRQLILVLSQLGVNDDVFLLLQQEEIEGLAIAMEDDIEAISRLSEFVDPNHATLFISHLVADGFRKTNDPFVTSLLRLWRAWRTKDLKDKAHITVQEGAFLLGCTDETRTLQGHFDAKQAAENASSEEKLEALPEIFVQISRVTSPGTIDIIEGVCILARNPSLHPGDIRVVRAVNVPQLHHLKDVVVLPQTGDRDIAGMCSGGDLDGDDYIVIWDSKMIPTKWNHPPMDYTPPPPKEATSEVRPIDIMRFFVQYMKNDVLGRIAHAHIAWADYLDEGLTSEKCLELAALHSKAVDYPKTGQHAVMDRSLKPTKWPHFMQKEYDASYHSKKILGKLFDAVHKVAFVPNFEGTFDDRILTAFDPEKEMLDDALELKAAYDEHISRIMALHEIKSEFEVFSTLCINHSRAVSNYKIHEELGRLSEALKQRFKDEAVLRAGGLEYEKLAPYAVAMYKVTAAQVQKALVECKAGERQMVVEEMPFMSFPWILHHTLSEIVSKRYRDVPEVSGEPEASSHNGISESGYVDTLQQPSNVEVSRLHHIDVVTPAPSVDLFHGLDAFEEKTKTPPAAIQQSMTDAPITADIPIRSSPLYTVAEPTGLVQTENSPKKSDNTSTVDTHLAANPMTQISSAVTEKSLSERGVTLAGSPDPLPQKIAYFPPRSLPTAQSVSTNSEGRGLLAKTPDSPEPLADFSSCSRRRRIYGHGRFGSTGRTNPDIEALLAQSDKLLEERRRSRGSGSLSGSTSSYASAAEVLDPIEPIAGNVPRQRSTAAISAKSPIPPCAKHSDPMVPTAIPARIMSHISQAKENNNTAVMGRAETYGLIASGSKPLLNTTTLPKPLALAQQSIGSANDDDEQDNITEFVPKARKETGLERLERLIRGV